MGYKQHGGGLHQNRSKVEIPKALVISLKLTGHHSKKKHMSCTFSKSDFLWFTTAQLLYICLHILSLCFVFVSSHAISFFLQPRTGQHTHKNLQQVCFQLWLCVTLIFVRTWHFDKLKSYDIECSIWARAACNAVAIDWRGSWKTANACKCSTSGWWDKHDYGINRWCSG